MSFILAHELAHIMEGHLGQKAGDRSLAMVDGHAASVRTHTIAHDVEHAADLAAMSCVVDMFRTLRVLAEVAFFFNVLSAIDKIGFEPTFWGHSHPSPALRLQRLIQSRGIVPEAHRNSFVQALNSYGDIGTKLPELVLDAPGQFRYPANPLGGTPRPEGDENLQPAAKLTNLGHQLLAADSPLALDYFMRADELLKTCSYGAGMRITASGIVEALLRRGDDAASVRALGDSVKVARIHNDKPAAKWLCREFVKAVTTLMIRLTPTAFRELSNAFATLEDGEFWTVLREVPRE